MKARLPQGYSAPRNNMSQMIKQAQKMQEQMEKAQEEINAKEYTTTVGGGVVEIKMTGDKVLRSITLKPEIVDPEAIEDLQDLVDSPGRIRKVIIGELEAVKKKYGQPRRTEIVYGHELETFDEAEETPDYPVTVFLSREGYFKKITPQSLRMADTQKYKENDGLRQSAETTNRAEVMFFTSRQQVYKCRLSDFDDAKASVLGDYLPTKLGMEPEEAVVGMVLPGDYGGSMLFFFENGKAARVELSAYATTSNRRRLTGAYSDKSPLAALLHLTEDRELVLYSSDSRALIFSTALLAPKTTRSTQGVQVMALKTRGRLAEVRELADSAITNLGRYRCRSIPAAGALLKEEDGDQMRLL